MEKKSASAFKVVWHASISQIAKEEWNRLAQPLAAPFMEWEWLWLLEESGSIGRETGWEPRHLAVCKGNRLVAAAPLYIKSHSEGEFVYDQIWADAAEQLKIPYYPKLVGMSPATPVPCYRFLTAQDEDEETITELMLDAIHALCAGQGLSGIHFLFPDPDWAGKIRRRGFGAWVHQLYRWQNRQFTTFADFMACFKKSERRNIRRERLKLAGQNIRLESLDGPEIPAAFFGRMFDFYAHTNAKFGPWGCKYLTKEFFLGLEKIYRHRTLLIAASKSDNPGEPVAMALYFHKGSRLFGRYWGGAEQIDALHFNVCYYAPIEWAIGRGFASFDPGIGGTHKARRGFEAYAGYSLHHFYNQTLSLLWRLNIDRINMLEQEYIDELKSLLPFKQESIKK